MIDHCIQARQALQLTYGSRLIPYTDDITVTARPEITYWQSPRPDVLMNIVRHVSAADSDLPRLIEEVNRAHRGRPSSWNIKEENGTLPRLLAEAGYSIRLRWKGYWIESDAPFPSQTDIIVERVVTPAQLEDFLRIDATVFGDGAVDPQEFAATARICFGERAQLRCFLAYNKSDPSVPIACSRLYLFDDLDFGLLQASGTLPHARGLGAYSALVAARVRHARDQGITRVGIYADEKTSAPIIERHSFHPCGTLTNWSRPASSG